ncbi:MAG: hypothetical protein ACKOWE_04660 [Micrococcales bacterium]
MIQLVSVFQESLNLNGDQANLAVLADYLERCGVEVKLTNVTSARELSTSKPDFVFFGHGSAAAHAQIDDELLAIAEQLRGTNIPVLFIGSSVEFAVEKLGLGDHRISRSERESLFSVGELANLKVLGYRNTDSGLPDIWQDGKLVFSMLHGPVLAKNPRLLAWLANEITPAKPLANQRDWFGKLNEVCQRIWELETEEKFEPLV